MRDVNRLRILQDVIDRNLRPGLAAEMLGITPRHSKFMVIPLRTLLILRDHIRTLIMQKWL